MLLPFDALQRYDCTKRNGKPNVRRKVATREIVRNGRWLCSEFFRLNLQQFIFDSIGMDMYARGMDAGGTSKAERLRYFWKVQPNQVVGKLLLALCDYYRVIENHPEQALLSECIEIARRLSAGQSIPTPTSSAVPVPQDQTLNYQSSTPIAAQSEELLRAFDDMAYCSEPIRRGYLLENLLVRTFQIHQIEVVRSFRRNNGSEQIDAAFKLEGWHYLVECRWREKLADTRQVDGLRGQVQRSGKQTMGVFLAINGWSSHVPGNLKQNPDKSVLLMDGYDLRVVLEGRIKLRELLLAKLTHFNIDSEPFVSVTQIIVNRT